MVNWRLLDVYTHRIADAVLAPAEEDLDVIAPGLPEVSGRVTLKNVGFQYSQNDPIIFKDIDADINPGEFVAIVGSSGAGKSTLIKNNMWPI
ncbi:ATP-binding cassette domain-containing protein [Caulobacter segnis]